MPRLWVCCVLVAWVSSPGGCAENVMSSESGYLMREHSLAAPYQGRTIQSYVPTQRVLCRTLYRCWSRDPVLGVWWGVCGDQLVCETHSRQAEQTGQPLEHRGTLVAAPTISLSLSLSLTLSLTLLSLPHSYTHTHTHTSPLPAFVQTASSCPQLGGGGPVQCTRSGSEPVWRRLCSLVHQRQGKLR